MSFNNVEPLVFFRKYSQKYLLGLFVASLLLVKIVF